MTEQYQIAEQLGERAPQAVALIGRIVRRLGPQQARQLAQDAMATAAAGGMLTDDGSRQRTLGGIFFVLVRQYVRANGQEQLEHEFFPRRHKRPTPAHSAKPVEPPQPSNLTPRPTQSAPPPPAAAAGRLRPRMRGRNELPSTTSPSPLPSPLPEELGTLAVQPNADAARPARPETSGQRDSNGALSEARRLLPPDTGCYGIGAMNESHTLLLRFHFPDVARVRYAATIDAIRAATGWEVTIHPSPHQEKLAAAARATLPEHVQSLAAPSLHFARQTITLRYRGDFSEAERNAASTRFQNETGWSLDFAAIG